jgi:hypothetical protein
MDRRPRHYARSSIHDSRTAPRRPKKTARARVSRFPFWFNPRWTQPRSQGAASRIFSLPLALTSCNHQPAIARKSNLYLSCFSSLDACIPEFCGTAQYTEGADEVPPSVPQPLRNWLCSVERFARFQREPRAAAIRYSPEIGFVPLRTKVMPLCRKIRSLAVPAWPEVAAPTESDCLVPSKSCLHP